MGEPAKVPSNDRRTQATYSNQRVSTLELDTILSSLEQQRYKNDAVGYAVQRVIAEGSAEQLISLVTALRERLRGQNPSRLFG